MLGRLTQDALENVFSSCRARNPVPNSKEFKTNLRLITLSQYSKKLKTNYSEDDARYIF
jgi:hypothetical protein